MALITNFTSLISEVKLWLNNSNTTDDTVKGFIQLAEDTIRIELALLENEERSRATVPAGAFIALPDGFNGLREAYVISSPNKPLIFITPSQMTALGNLTGNPTFMSIVDGQFKFSPDIAGDEVEVVYFRELVSLSDSVATNFLITEFPSVYLSATLSVAQKFLRDDVDSSQHDAIFTRYLESLKRRDARRKYAGQIKQIGVNPVVARLG